MRLNCNTPVLQYSNTPLLQLSLIKCSLAALAGCLLLLRGAALSGSQADWQTDWERAVKAAEKEGELSFYTRFLNPPLTPS